ncbi:hypothetical protein RhiJN_13553 [Ceratobasidium sp. AG-Ba]|nr:hypothetical protein RhiJN_13553 [Ceratobasidium sp. AG-Ba]
MLFKTVAALVTLGSPAISASALAPWYGCSVSNAKLQLPPTGGLSIPSNAKPVYITLGFGTQNYTCTSAGTYTSAGAVAKLVDLSCLYHFDKNAFNKIQDKAYSTIPTNSHQAPNWDKIKPVLSPYTKILGDHYFTPQANNASAPEFDFRAESRKGDRDAYSINQKVGGIPSPDGSQHVDWLQLESTSGKLAKHTFRVDTRGGVPPSSCETVGQTTEVPYIAKYWFFN